MRLKTLVNESGVKSIKNTNNLKGSFRPRQFGINCARANHVTTTPLSIFFKMNVRARHQLNGNYHAALKLFTNKTNQHGLEQLVKLPFLVV